MDLDDKCRGWGADVDCISCESVNSGDAFLYNKYPYSSSELDLGIFLLKLNQLSPDIPTTRL
jgi:hypothetical protein